ncbi:hypothetical protein [Nocardia cyriacigeorgica]|uniref:hypothetical protein n=1 Tax=Nocardia cyriacigeorgica TaxID=135487 RepID=UPI0034DB6431
MDLRTGRIILTVGSVTGVTMPADFGRAMLSSKGFRPVIIGPVVSHPRSRRWTILARSNIADYREVFSHLYRLDTTLAPLGAQIALPSPADGARALRTWVYAPLGAGLPLATDVIDDLLLSRQEARR